MPCALEGEPLYVMWLAAAERRRARRPGIGSPSRANSRRRKAGPPRPRREPVGLQRRARHPVAIARAYSDRCPDRRLDDVVTTTDRQADSLLAFLACFDVGDRVAIASPGYPCYRNILTALGCEVVELPCGPDTRYQPTAAMLAEAGPLDG